MLVQNNFVLFLHYEKTADKAMDIETATSNFLSELRQIGLDNNGALLIQVQIDGVNHIMSYGNLNNFAAGAKMMEKKGDSLIKFMEREIPIASIRESTKKIHLDTLNQIRSFSPNISLQEVSSDFLLEFEIHMREVCNLSTNTIARHMKSLKRYINIARKKRIITEYPFLNYTIRTEQVHRDALTEKELEILEKYRDNLAEPNEALNAFLFSCYTGLRYSDVRMFTKQNIYTINRKKWIVLKMYKTNKEIRIPLSTIFEGKALELTRSISRNRGVIFRIGSNQQANRDLKKIAKQVGIKKMTFHTARHTCATLLLYRGVSITTVQTILGHQSVKTTQIYSAVTDMTLERDLKKGSAKKGRGEKIRRRKQ